MWPRSKFAKADLHRALHQGAGGRPFAEETHPGLPLEALNTAYLAEVACRGRAPSTQKPLRTRVRKWAQVCEELGVHPLAVQKEHVEAYRRGLERAGLPDMSIRTELKSLRQMYSAWEKAGLIDRNPARPIALPPGHRKSPREPLTLEQLRAVLEASERHGPGVSGAIHLMGLCGVRRQDYRALRIEDIGMRDGMMTLHLRHRKGGVEGRIGVPDVVAEKIRAAVGRRTTGPVFLGPRGGPLEDSRMTATLGRIVRELGLDRRLSPHDFRVTFITLSLEAGVPVREVMASAGHSSQEMTYYYDKARIALFRHAAHTLAGEIMQRLET